MATGIYVVGIDPGLYGAIAVVGDNHAQVFDMPLMSKGSGAVQNEVNPAAVHRILTDIDEEWKIDIVGIEQVSGMPGQGAAGTFSLGDSYGVVRSVAACLGLPMERIHAAKWKRALGLDRDKEKSRAMAIRLFPKIDLHLKKHADRAEALLIAHYMLTSGSALLGERFKEPV